MAGVVILAGKFKFWEVTDVDYREIGWLTRACECSREMARVVVYRPWQGIWILRSDRRCPRSEHVLLGAAARWGAPSDIASGEKFECWEVIDASVGQEANTHLWVQQLDGAHGGTSILAGILNFEKWETYGLAERWARGYGCSGWMARLVESLLVENLNFKKLPTYGLAEQLRRTWKCSC